MREIKFRGVSLDTGIMVYGSLINYDPIPEIQETTIGEMDYDYPSNEVKSESVGQYTGLKDKNGTEIYEGDILRKTIELKGGLIGNWIVYYGEAGFDIKNVDDSSEVKTMYLKKYWKHSYEVIGNIHDNPELLK